MMPETPSASSEARLAPSARAADAASAALIVVALWWILVGRPVGVFNSVSDALSPAILFYVAGSIQVVRHLVWPRPSVASRLAQARERIRAKPHLSAACRAFLTTRPAVFVIAIAAVACCIGGATAWSAAEERPYVPKFAPDVATAWQVNHPDGDDYIAIRQMAYFALTYDHRVVDGADAERFLSYMKQYLEHAPFTF